MGFAFTPMRRLYFQTPLRIGVDPAAIRQAAGEHQGIGAELIGDLQLDFSVRRRGFDRFPETVVLFGTIKGHAGTQNPICPTDSNAGRRERFPGV